MGIKCPNCQHENPEDTLYCGKCAGPLKPAEGISITKTLITPMESLQKGSTIAGRYQILEELGRGGMGIVFQAEDTKLKRAVALELDDTLAEVHYTLALIKTWTDWDWEGAEAAFLKALELNPNYPDARVYYSNLLCYLGRWDEALTQAERGLELDPLNSLFLGISGIVLMYLERYDDAIMRFQNVLRTSPNDPVGHNSLWEAFHIKGMYEEALESAKAFFTALDLAPIVEVMAQGYEQDGYSGAMRSAAETLAAFSQETFISPWWISFVYAFAGEKEQTLKWLERAYEMKDPMMPYTGGGIIFETLGGDPRYQDLLRRMNLPEGR